ncbi:MAG TPA: DUF481 domain-containing protein [Vicinamibacterales bacterium]
MKTIEVTRACVVVVCLVAADRALVHAQDAVVEVATGDRITGDVRVLDRGRLAFRTRAASQPGAQRWAGTISIVWAEVVSLSSTQHLEVELSSGERFFGSISSPSPRRLIVDTASGPSRPIEMSDVVTIVPVEDTFRARMTGSIDFGLTFSNARDTTTYTLNGTADYRSPGHAYDTRASLSSWLSAQEGAPTLTRNDVAVDLRRGLADRWFALAHGTVQQDDPLELDLRVLLGGGIGRRIVQSNRTRVVAFGGLVWNAENYTGIDTDHSAEAAGGVEWDWFEIGGVTEAMVSATTYISLARERVRLEVDASVRRDLLWDLYWAFNLFESFDGDPPNDRPRSDLGLSVTVGWAF